MAKLEVLFCSVFVYCFDFIPDPCVQVFPNHQMLGSLDFLSEVCSSFSSFSSAPPSAVLAAILCAK